jgi:hypothetical protein
MYSSTCSSTLNNDTFIDSNDDHDVLLDMNACNMTTISYTSCIDLKHEIDDLKQVCDNLSAKLVEHNENSANLNARSSLLGACWECPKVKLELDARSLNVKKFETKLLEKSHVSVTSSPCELCVSLKGKLVHATNENTMLVKVVAHLTSRRERTKLIEKMIEEC